jgi:hypothetical protein
MLYMQRRLAELSRILERFDEAPERIAAVVYQNFVALRDDRDATVAFAREISRFAEDRTMATVRKLRAQYSGLVRSIVEQGVADGTFATGDPHLSSLQIFGMYNWAWTWLDPAGPSSFEDIAVSFVDLLLNGLMARGDGPKRGALTRPVRKAVDEIVATSG